TVEWEPATPRQGTALAVRVLRPPGREQPSAITAWLGGRTVRLGRGGSGWFGFAALPLDSAGVFELVVAYRQAGAPHEDRYLVGVRERTYPSARVRIGSRGEARPDVRERIRRDRERIWEALVSSGDEWLLSAPFEWPRPPEVTSPYGQRRVFNGRIHGRHMGLDLRGGRGAPVIAPAAGRVLLTGNFFYQGSAVYLDHGLGLVTAYFHLSDIVVTEGQRVESGQLLGRVGSTGRSTAPHLHWSAYVGGDNVDPASLVGLPWDGPVAASASAAGEGR
ncbi:MAG: M23 family metallopeptidase, partial [Gemmatimonadota bacterium]